MKRTAWLLACLLITMAVNAQNKVNPVVKKFGTITEVPYSVENPDPKLDYKIVIEINSENPKPEMVHEFFDKVASVVNLHALGGVPAKKLHVIMVIHGPAAQLVVNNEAYRKKYNLDNPNIPLFKELTDAGVKIFVCGQSLNKRSIAPESVAAEVKPALSAITTLTTYQLKGYSLLKF
jgi:intracellular sulfur oxidation DsrE/DsrF family protein